MKFFSLRKFYFFLFLLRPFPLSASTETVVEIADRCNLDSLTPEQAIERTLWARNCGYLTRKRADSYLTDDNGEPLQRPMYPAFYNHHDPSQVWTEAPTSRNAPCIPIPPIYSSMAGCTSSCYPPEERVVFWNASASRAHRVSMKKAFTSKLPEVVTLSEESFLEALSFKTTPVKSYTRELGPSWHTVLEFRTQSGGTLRVTENHPMVDGKGFIKEASAFHKDDSFFHVLLGNDPIVKRKKYGFYGKVYNLDTRSESGFEKIVIAGTNFLSGTSYYQNEGFSHINRQLLRESLRDGVDL